jgi:lipoprotein NlpD
VPQLSGKLSWQWPVLGKLAEQFGTRGKLNKGIDIAAAKGSQVRAAAAGIVVYAGDGIHGYGNLLIIKHSDLYMSAYAYNSHLLVAEGELVEAGQTIAKVGFGPEQQARLHFEIRKNGQPIDPLLFLPKR